MQNSTSVKIYLTIFVYVTILTLGGVIITFLNLYFSGDSDKIVAGLLQVFSIRLPIVAIMILNASLALILFFRINVRHPGAIVPDFVKIRRHIVLQYLLALLLVLNQFLYEFDKQFHILELAGFLLAVWLINDLGRQFEQSPVPDWRHPTTRSLFLFAAGVGGCALLFGIQEGLVAEAWITWLFVIMLLTYLLTIFSRFRFLSGNSKQTNAIARQLFGKYGIYFSIRIVLGLFMPLGYAVYAIYFNSEFLFATVPFVVIGEFLDKFLFIFVSSAWDD